MIDPRANLLNRPLKFFFSPPLKQMAFLSFVEINFLRQARCVFLEEKERKSLSVVQVNSREFLTIPNGISLTLILVN